ncbi:unnamed protein product [Effrenium voratum]|nr:unnamed protein product [Effrenium voratum]
MDLLPEKIRPSPWTRNLMSLLAMVLNMADFGTDVMVLLGLSCALPAPHAACVNATHTDAIASAASCEPHTAWFAISATILVVSTVLSSCMWAMPREGCCGFCCWYFVLGLLQLGDAAELVQFLRGELKDGLRQWRILFGKVLESVPQAYLQGYVLLHTKRRMEPFQLASISVSGLSLAFGLVTSMAEMFSSSRLKTAQGKVLGFVFFALDVWARCTAVALGLVPSVRLAACGVIAGYWVLSLAAYLKMRGWPGCGTFFWEFVFGQLFFVYIVPAAAITQGPSELPGPLKRTWQVLRFLESAGLCGAALGLGLGTCQQPLVPEALASLALVAASVVPWLGLQLLDDEGQFRGLPSLPGTPMGRSAPLDTE